MPERVYKYLYETGEVHVESNCGTAVHCEIVSLLVCADFRNVDWFPGEVSDITVAQTVKTREILVVKSRSLHRRSCFTVLCLSQGSTSAQLRRQYLKFLLGYLKTLFAVTLLVLFLLLS
jgi:hypothetical protein